MACLECLLEGLERAGLEVRSLRKPRIREMYSYEVLYRGKHVAYVRFFAGRPPHYRGWIEFYTINWGLARSLGLDKVLVRVAAEALETNETLYFEYVGDGETEKQLEQGVSPEETRIGRLMAMYGFRSIEDMYYPEGFMEGGPKLRGHKS